MIEIDDRLRDPEWLEREYWDEGRSLAGIGDEFGEHVPIAHELVELGEEVPAGVVAAPLFEMVAPGLVVFHGLGRVVGE